MGAATVLKLFFKAGHEHTIMDLYFPTNAEAVKELYFINGMKERGNKSYIVSSKKTHALISLEDLFYSVVERVDE